MAAPRPRRSVLRALAGFCTAVCTLAVTPPAHADDAARAKQLFDDGREAVRGGDFARGCPLMLESQKLVASIGALFNLALCDEHDLALLQARRRWQDAVELAKQRGDERQALAQERLVELGPQIPTAQVVIARGAEVSKASAGAIGKLDGELMTAASLQAPVEMDPGEHTIEITLAGRPSASVTFQILVGEHITVAVPFASAQTEPVSKPADKPLEPTPADGDDTLRNVGIVLLGVGAASFVVSAVTGALYLGERSTVDEHCDVSFSCDQEGFDAASSADTLGTVNGVTLLGGLFAATAGVALIWLAPGNTEVRAQPVVGESFGLVQLEGRF